MSKKIKTTQHLYPTDITATGATKLREYEAVKKCKHCGNKFVINQLKRGREPIYCGSVCRVKEYRKKHGTTLLTDIIGGNMTGNNDNLPAKSKNYLPAKLSATKFKITPKKLGYDTTITAIAGLLANLGYDLGKNYFTKEEDKTLTRAEYRGNQKAMRNYFNKRFAKIDLKIEELIEEIKKKIPTFF